MVTINLSELFLVKESSQQLKTVGLTRSISSLKAYESIIDQYSQVTSASIRISSEENVTFICEHAYHFEKVESGGYLGRPIDKKQPFLWLPKPPIKRKINTDRHILSEQSASLQGLQWIDHTASFTLKTNKNTNFDLVIWHFPNDFPIEEITSISSLEYQGSFLWGSHGSVSCPADLYNHLIHGSIYDLRYSWPHNKKCFSENEAHALYTSFSGLEKTTGKSIYRFFQQQIVLSIIQRQSNDGGWYHGMWTDNTECHYRLHTSAVHLLLDEFQRNDCEQVKAALVKGVQFLSKTTDQLDCGTWFLHDSLELSEEVMNSGPFNWIPNRVLGKSTSNMLVLNTHLDTTIAINRYGELTGDKQYQSLVDSALNSTRAVLALQPANWLYKPLFWAIGLTMLPTDKASALPAPVRAIKRVAWQYLIKKLPDIKSRFPRIVMPNGYIDRELSLRTWAIDYQTINIMDLARYAHAFPNAFDESILDKAMEFTHSSGLIKRYRELTPGKRYSVGFWAEALYYRCLSKGDLEYRQWLVEAMLECHDLEFGMAPSLLGSNGEARRAYQATGFPCLNVKHLLMANLSQNDKTEILLVNSRDKELIISDLPQPYINLIWFDSTGLKLSKDNLYISKNNWIRGITL
ncbi:MAG: hypothetical protein GQ532_01200 [Methylomarinum sp.]|nr:hypothetical protein [Methylomarinum sp.]